MKIFIFEPKKCFDNELIKHIDLKSVFAKSVHFKLLFPKDSYEVVQNPVSADFIVLPHDVQTVINNLGLFGLLGLFDRCDLYHKFYWKFIFIYVDDCSWKIPMSGTWLRLSFDNRVSSDESICIPCFCDDFCQYFAEGIDLKNTDNCIFRGNFVGATHTHPIRHKLISYLSHNNFWSKVFLLIRTNFHSNPLIDIFEREKRKRHLVEAINKSYMTFCPRGTAMTSTRFYETMSLGRIPILFAEYGSLPFQDEINYQEFSFNISYDKFNEIGKILDTSDKKLEIMCNTSYKIYHEFLSPKSYGKKLVDFLKKNKGKIYETRKNDSIFHCQLDKVSLYDYCFDYLLKYQEEEELVNVFELANHLSSSTDDANKIELLNYIRQKSVEHIGFQITTTSVAYLEALRIFLNKEHGIKFRKDQVSDSLKEPEDFGLITQSYIENVLE